MYYLLSLSFLTGGLAKTRLRKTNGKSYKIGF